MILDPNHASDSGKRASEVASEASVTILLWNHGPLRLPVAFDPAPTSAPPRRTPEMTEAAAAAGRLLRPALAGAIGASLAVAGLLSWLPGRGRTPW